MKFSSRDKTMFQTVFAPTPAEACTLLDYVRFLWEERIGERIANDPLYRPSDLWRQWAAQTFTGFSLEKLLLQGGHAFPASMEVAAGPMAPQPRWRRALGALLGGKEAERIRQGREVGPLQAWFRRFYPQVGICPEHAHWYAWHPNPYFRCLEAYVLREKRPLPATMLEVGAGACVNVAFYRSLNPALRATVVDLPETMLFGYCFLKSVFPDLRVTLPHQVESNQTGAEAEVRFLLPTQVETVPSESMDFCFNMSSFQEMTIDSVNHYLRFLARVLKPGGTLLSVNLETSRYLAGNALKNYDFALYHAAPRLKPAPFGTDLIDHVPGMNIVHAEVTKGGGPQGVAEA
ncbi:MAG: hypothetical protein UZ03_NOB001001714 [Nitrospira sp. OLB3]|nr:MAG: hypothetical protein UZ03_NOB001001714 [Nitrospira sp. OLB3]MCE7964267.1 putative sugar O-methyltransferase [Nitrospira sp. NTP2]MEB2337273.1 putative sugar O-methyltransferase [Nitrospirales bacterium]QOJ36660.1 MAG: putative sugar O-methyltransferase [Nitrospira sp.]RIK60212.1 MAG: hypothetical protein DCC63_03830 [Nitrospira sp.]